MLNDPSRPHQSFAPLSFYQDVNDKIYTKSRRRAGNHFIRLNRDQNPFPQPFGLIHRDPERGFENASFVLPGFML